MSQRRRERGPVVIDTGVFGADLVPGSPLTVLYEPVIAGRPSLISFQTVAELRYGALRRGWGESRMLKLRAKISRSAVVWAGPELVETYAKLRVECEAAGHALAQRPHAEGRGFKSHPRHHRIQFMGPRFGGVSLVGGSSTGGM